LSSLSNTTSDGEKFCFSESDVDCMIEGLNDGIFMHIDMSNGSGHLTFDACIRDYNSCICLSQSLENKFIKYVKICFFAFFAFSI